MKRVLEPEDSARVIEILNESGAKAYSEARAKNIMAEALSSLESIDISEDCLAEFESLLKIATTQPFFNVDDTVLE